MTPLPKRRLSSMRSGKRRQAINLAAANVSACPNCGKPKLAHMVCKECGVYGGRVVAPPKVRTTVKRLSSAKEETGQEAQSS